MGKRQSDCVACGAPVDIIGRELCCRCVRRQRERDAKQPCPDCGRDRVLVVATGRCVLCSRRCVECGHPVRQADATLCKTCRRRADLTARQQRCPRCGKPGYLRAETGWCGSCSRPGPPKDPPSLDTLENIKAYTTALVAKARDEYQRRITPMTYGLVVCRDTENEAKADFQRVLDHGDHGAASNVLNMAMSGASQSFEHAKRFQERFIAGWGGYPIVGTPEQCVDEFAKLHEAGMNGMIMGMIDYHAEMESFGENVLPLLKEAGLRH